MDMLTVVGMPLEVKGKLYNTAVVLKDGQILGVIPKPLFRIMESSMKPGILNGAQKNLYASGWRVRKPGLVRICFLNVKMYRDLLSAVKSARICGHRIRRVYPMRWRVPQCF